MELATNMSLVAFMRTALEVFRCGKGDYNKLRSERGEKLDCSFRSWMVKGGKTDTRWRW